MLARMHRSDEVIAAYQQALTFDLSVYQKTATHKLIAYLHAEGKRFPQAVEAMKQALALADDDQTHLDLGQLYVKMGDRDSALHEYEFLKEKQSSRADFLWREIINQ